MWGIIQIKRLLLHSANVHIEPSKSSLHLNLDWTFPHLSSIKINS